MIKTWQVMGLQGSVLDNRRAGDLARQGLNLALPFQSVVQQALLTTDAEGEWGFGSP